MSISASSLCRLSFPCLCLFMCLCKTFVLAISYDSILSPDLPSFSVFFIMEFSPLFLYIQLTYFLCFGNPKTFELFINSVLVRT
jgi:hypothetical protein